MSFGESVFSTGFNHKNVKVDLHVRFNCAYPPRNEHQKTLEDSRGLHAEAESEGLPGGAIRPHLQAARPLGPPVDLCVAMSVLHHLLGRIYVVP